jgi:hypothetical protein
MFLATTACRLAVRGYRANAWRFISVYRRPLSRERAIKNVRRRLLIIRTTKRALVSSLASTVVALCFVNSVVAGVTLPQVTGPLPGTPFNGNAIETKPVDLEKLGYDEREFLISGQSNVYDWSAGADFAATVLRSGRYTTRIVVRRPIDQRRWDGTAVVEIVNMSGFGRNAGFDYEGVWANNWREITHQGMAYVGITSKPNVFDSLQRFDRERYASLSMANPLPPEQQACGTLPGDAGYNADLSRLFENGLIYDAFTQLGALLHSDSPSNPLGGPAQRVYLTGLSQSVGYLKTYLRFVAPMAKLENGALIYNGYRAEGGGGAGAPINQCAAKLPSGDRQLAIPDRGAPMIELHSSADFAADLPRQPDEPWYRRWEVAGTFHDDTWTFQHGFPIDQVFRQVLPQVPGVTEWVPRCKSDYPPDPPYEDVYDSSLRALDEWVRYGIPAPHVPYIQAVKGLTALELGAVSARANRARDQQQILDQHGNPRGGLRLPAVDVPVATYRAGPVFEPTADCAYKVRFSNTVLKQLYPSHGRYVQLVTESASGLVDQGLLTPEDALQEILEAARSDVP